MLAADGAYPLSDLKTIGALAGGPVGNGGSNQNAKTRSYLNALRKKERYEMIDTKSAAGPQAAPETSAQNTAHRRKPYVTFPRDRLGIRANCAFVEWMRTLTPKQQRKLSALPR